MKKMYKIWGPDAIVYYVEKENMDEAFAEVRKLNPAVDTAQLCAEEEARRIRNEKVCSE